jgi:hypothetical protein
MPLPINPAGSVYRYARFLAGQGMVQYGTVCIRIVLCVLVLVCVRWQLWHSPPCWGSNHSCSSSISSGVGDIAGVVGRGSWHLPWRLRRVVDGSRGSSKIGWCKPAATLLLWLRASVTSIVRPQVRCSDVTAQIWRFLRRWSVLVWQWQHGTAIRLRTEYRYRYC